MTVERVAGSFRDPAGFVFEVDGRVHRRVHPSYREHYDRLVGGGLAARLVEHALLVDHTEVGLIEGVEPGGYVDLLPEQVPFVSYPYEWSFGALRDAALATLSIQAQALEHDMTLKDASAYNIQFIRGRPILIDTLSFETYEAGKPWVAYQQFCQHFVAPLALMSHRDVRLGQLLRSFLDGIPVDLASKLLPRRSYCRFGLLMHVHLLAMAQRRYAQRREAAAKHRPISKRSLQGIIESLRALVTRLEWAPVGTEWSDYYERNNNYGTESFAAKEQLVNEALDLVHPDSVWDLGANTAHFSRLASDRGCRTVAFDVDPACVEITYRQVRKRGEENLLPLWIDLTNPSPGLGWDNDERSPLPSRGHPQLVLALALVHHLAISNNLPLDRIARYLAKLAPHLVIEFVPKSDSMVQTLLATREDIFTEYSPQGFEAAFAPYFSIRNRRQIGGSERTLYLMERRAS